MNRNDLTAQCGCGEQMQVQAILPDFVILSCPGCKEKAVKQDGEIKPIRFPTME